MGVMALSLGGVLEAFSLLLLVPVLGTLVSGGSASQFDILLTRLVGQGRDGLKWALFLLAGCGTGSSILKFVGEALILDIRSRMETQAGNAMANALLDVAWEPFASLRQGDIAKSLLIEGNQMAYGVRQYLTGLGAVLTALPLVLSACLMSPEMTAYTLAFGAAAALLFRFASAPVRGHVARLSSSVSAISLRIADIFGNLKFFRSTGLTGQARDDAEKTYQAYAAAYFDSQIYPAALRYAVEAGALIFIAGFLYWQLAVDNSSPAAVLVFLAIFYRLVPKIMAAQDFLFQATTYLPWYESWRKRLAFCEAHRKIDAGKKAPEFGTGLAFHRASFSYANGFEVLRGIDLVVPPGRCVAVVGASGSGKTTLLDLAVGLLQPTAGHLTLGGQPISEIDLQQWQKKIGLVPQDCPVFFATVLENIAWGDPEPNRELALKCARQANAWEFIERLPQGIDTLIGERGANLSGGQRQRLGIARALYRRPCLLILDEATSALDGFSEKAVQQALAEVKGSFAILLVAHRLHTVAMADEIIVIDQGKVAERGHFDQLVEQRGLFYELLRMQTKSIQHEGRG